MVLGINYYHHQQTPLKNLRVMRALIAFEKIRRRALGPGNLTNYHFDGVVPFLP